MAGERRICHRHLCCGEPRRRSRAPGLWAPLQMRRSRGTKTCDWLSVKVLSVQHHQDSGSVFPDDVETKAGKGSSLKLCAPLLPMLGA